MYGDSWDFEDDSKREIETEEKRTEEIEAEEKRTEARQTEEGKAEERQTEKREYEQTAAEGQKSSREAAEETAAGDISREAQRGEDVFASERQGYRMDRSYIPEEPKERRRKKKTSIAARVAGITASALLFGSVAGATMFGVNMAAGKMTSALYPTVKQSETLAEAPTAAEENASGEVVATAAYMDVSAIVKKAMPSVVAITNKQIYQSNSWFFGPSQYEGQSSGSGIIIGQNDTELLVVTNNHVVEGSTELKVTFIDNNTVDAAIKGTDSESDLAVIAIQKKDISESTLAEISIAAIGDSDTLEAGQGVVAIGNALGYGQSTTVGYISALNREVQTKDSSSGQVVTRSMIQVDAAINPGNSGGALLNMKGEVIGINAAKYSSTDVEGIGYAIPISYAEEIIGDLINRQTRIVVDEKEQGYLGIQGQNITQEMAQAFGMPRGVYIYKILEGGAAANSELKEKDIITKIDGSSVKTMSDLQEMLTYFKGDSTVTLTVQTLVDGEYQEKTVDVKLGYRADAQKLQEQQTQESGQ